MFRILTLAGGGLRGAFGIGLLEEFEQRCDRPLWEYFDLIAGTSTGSITATALCTGITAGQMREFYQEHSAKIFHPRERYKPKGILRLIYPIIRSLLARRKTDPDYFFQSRYCPHSLTAAMEDGFGSKTLREANHCRLVVPALNLTDGLTAVMRTPHLPGQPNCYDWKLSDVIVASAAAPTYFPHKRMPDGKDYADGGLWAIDPGVVALSEAVQIMEQCCRREDSPFDLKEVSMLSLGTGQVTFSLSPPGGDAGTLFWAKHIADVMGIAQIQGAQLPLRIVLGDRYQQIDFPVEDPDWTLDNIHITDELFRRGRECGARLYNDVKGRFLSEPTDPYCPFIT